MCELLLIKHRWVLHLEEAERETLTHAVRQHPHPDARERAAALLRLDQGHSPHWVARHALLRPREPDSLYQWMHWYAEGGVAALFQRRHGGAHRRRLRPGAARA